MVQTQNLSYFIKMCIRDSYNSGSTAGATAAVGEVAKGLLGPVGGIIAILGVIVLPITSGDTAVSYTHLDVYKRQSILW